MPAKVNPETKWWVYLIRTPRNALYCGITTDVERRFTQHQNGTGAKALRGKKPLTLEWSRQVGASRGDALRLEYQIKRLSKMQKERLMIDESLFCELSRDATA